MANGSSSGGGLGLGSVLAVVFTVLKLTHVIDWSWWWVLFPAWGLLAIAGILYGIYKIAEKFGKA